MNDGAEDIEVQRSKEKLEVDVIIPTWNSASRLERSIDSVRRELDAKNIIVVDRDSKDGTAELAKNKGATVLTDTVSLGSARARGIRESDSDWVAFVDDDIVLPMGFGTEAGKFIDEGVGAVQAAVVSVHQPMRDILMREYLERFSKQDHYDMRSGERGMTSATLIRRELVSDLDLANIDAWEDWLITQKVIDSGYRWVVPRLFAEHFHQFEDLTTKGGWNAAGILNLGRRKKMPIGQALRWYMNAVLRPPKKAIKDTIRYRDPGLFLFQTKMLLNVLAAPIYLLRVVPRKPAAIGDSQS